MRYRKSKISSKILTLLLGGLALGLTRSPRQYFKILGEVSEELRDINRSSLKRSIRNLHRSGMLKEIKNDDGTVSILLSNRGKKTAQMSVLGTLKINKSKKWDGNWRIVIFDVPEKVKKIRDVIRMHLKILGFHELQKSVFVYPFPCADEMNQIFDFYDARKYIRVIMAHSIDNEEELMSIFGVR